MAFGAGATVTRSWCGTSTLRSHMGKSVISRDDVGVITPNSLIFRSSGIQTGYLRCVFPTAVNDSRDIPTVVFESIKVIVEAVVHVP
jgi:hypothetical protein